MWWKHFLLLLFKSLKLFYKARTLSVVHKKAMVLLLILYHLYHLCISQIISYINWYPNHKELETWINQVTVPLQKWMYFTIFQVQVRTGRAFSKYDLSRQLRGRNEDKLKTLLIFKLLTYVVKSLTHCWCQDFNGPPNCGVKSVKNPYEYCGHQSSPLFFFFSLSI